MASRPWHRHRGAASNEAQQSSNELVNQTAIGKTHKCFVCSLVFRTTQDLEFHLHSAHSNENEATKRVVAENQRDQPGRSTNLYCNYCNVVISTSYFAHNLNVHWKLRSINGCVFACSQCPFRSRSSKTRDAHMQNVHPGIQLKTMNLQEHHRTKFFCWLCSAFCPTDAELFEHCKRAHPDAEDWDSKKYEHEKRTGKKMVLIGDSNCQLEHVDREASDELHCFVCKVRMKATEIDEHVRVAHLGSRQEDRIVWQCPICNYKSKMRNSRDTHVRSQHSTVELIQCPNRGFIKKFKCNICNYIANARFLLVKHMIEAHGPEPEHEPEHEQEAEAFEQPEDKSSEPSSSSDEEEEKIKKEQFDSDESDHELPVVVPIIRPIKVEPQSSEKPKKRKKEMEPSTSKKSKLVEEEEQMNDESTSNSPILDPHHNAPSSSLASSSEWLSLQTLATTMLQQPSVIYYDYHMLSWKLGTLPIDLWKAADGCKVLFLRLHSNQWDREPELDHPLVSASMLRFDAPRHANRDAFLLGFVKTSAEDMAATLLTETNRHMSFDELVGELIPSLGTNSALIIANGVDRQTALEKQNENPPMVYNVV